MNLPSLRKLTPREREVLHWLAEGKTSWEIGRILVCSAGTVKKHRCNIYRKLGVENAVSAASCNWESSATSTA